MPFARHCHGSAKVSRRAVRAEVVAENARGCSKAHREALGVGGRGRVGPAARRAPARCKTVEHVLRSVFNVTRWPRRSPAPFRKSVRSAAAADARHAPVGGTNSRCGSAPEVHAPTDG
jgi:hypothetical protein